jgi:hypothetical protein
METLATPGTPVRRGTTFQCAWTVISISGTVVELRPMLMMRLAEETGCSRTGGLEMFGSATGAWDSRSCTICRACIRLVPGVKDSSMVDTPAMDSDSMVRSHGTPLRRSASSGTVIRASTSTFDRPSASVFTVREGGENSGTTSSGAVRSCQLPKPNRTAATATTRVRKRRLDRMIHRI